MEICGIICEFNPFHNGHEYLLKRAKELSGCDILLCIMSGNFTQRGDIAVLDKHVRAKHAVLGGADCVVELPAAFSCAPAEIFAEGAVKLLSAIPKLTSVAFGTECGNITKIIKASEILSEENKTFKAELANKLNAGESYIKSYSSAFKTAGGDEEIIQKPNNVLAIEYVKAFKRTEKAIKFYSVKRLGSDYNDYALNENYSSASAIRKNILSAKIKSNVPLYVYSDLKSCRNLITHYHESLKLILSRTAAEELKQVYGCTEGLENVLKNLENQPFNSIIKGATSRRYTSTRIKRILCENFLNVRKNDCENYLKSSLYYSPLAVNKSSADKVFSALSESGLPIITSKTDENKLSSFAKACKATDDFAYGQWLQLSGQTKRISMITV